VTQLVASQISWGGFANGQIPLTAMRYSPASGYLHPAASAAWEQLYAAALTEGFDLRGSGYRPASAGGATAGRSNHGWGLAIDITVLVPGNRYPNVDAAFASPEYEWLVANAARWGWINPAWAKPVTLGGTAAGGHVGDQCCFLEPWHWEWAAFMNPLSLPLESFRIQADPTAGSVSSGDSDTNASAVATGTTASGTHAPSSSRSTVKTSSTTVIRYRCWLAELDHHGVSDAAGVVGTRRPLRDGCVGDHGRGQRHAA
jgi:hypothetical protein